MCRRTPSWRAIRRADPAICRLGGTQLPLAKAAARTIALAAKATAPAGLRLSVLVNGRSAGGRSAHRRVRGRQRRRHGCEAVCLRAGRWLRVTVCDTGALRWRQRHQRRTVPQPGASLQCGAGRVVNSGVVDAADCSCRSTSTMDRRCCGVWLATAWAMVCPLTWMGNIFYDDVGMTQNGVNWQFYACVGGRAFWATGCWR